MSRRRFVVVLAFLWLGALTGFFYKYRGDLGAVGEVLVSARSERAGLGDDLRALGEIQRQQATTLVRLETAIAANTEICGQHTPDLSDRLITSEGRLAFLEQHVADLASATETLAARTTSNIHAREKLEQRIFRK